MCIYYFVSNAGLRGSLNVVRVAVFRWWGRQAAQLRRALQRQAFVRSVHGQWDGAYVLRIDMGPFILGEHYWLEGLVLVVPAVRGRPGCVHVVPERLLHTSGTGWGRLIGSGGMP